MYLRASSRSQGTIYNYQSDIKIFFVFLLNQCDNKFFGNIFPRDIVSYQSWCMEDLKLSGNRVRRLKDSLSSFSNYVEKYYQDDERLKDFKNITRTISSPKRRKIRVETELTDSDVKIIFEKLIEEEKYNVACVLALALYGGLRKAEIPQILTETFSKENIVGTLYKTPNKIKLKGDKYSNVYFIKQDMDRFIYLWKRQRKRMFRRHGHPSPEMESYLLIHSFQGKFRRYMPDSLVYMAKVITDVMKKNGINKEFYFESARKYFVKRVNETVKDPAERKLLLQNM